MSRYRWMLYLLALTVLLIGGLPRVAAQEEEPQRTGLRPDAPEFGKRGPYVVGHRLVVIDEGTDHPLEADLWYPALNPNGVAEEIAYEFTPKSPELGGDGPVIINGHALAGAPLDDSMGPYPLVVFSHGFSLNPEWYVPLLEHYASHGFIVLAPEHVEHDWAESAAASIDRPAVIKQALDYAEAATTPDGELAGQIDMDNVAVVGHSLGGYTALAMGGAQYDLNAFSQRCAELPEDDPKTFLCMPVIGQEEAMATRAGLDSVPDGLWPSFGDSRVTAIVPIAGDAFLFDEAGLAKITVPMMAIGGTADTGTPFDWGPGPSYEFASSAHKALVAFDGAEHMFVGTPCDSIPWADELAYRDFFCYDPVWDKERAWILPITSRPRSCWLS